MADEGWVYSMSAVADFVAGHIDHLEFFPGQGQLDVQMVQIELAVFECNFGAVENYGLGWEQNEDETLMMRVATVAENVLMTAAAAASVADTIVAAAVFASIIVVAADGNCEGKRVHWMLWRRIQSSCYCCHGNDYGADCYPS